MLLKEALLYTSIKSGKSSFINKLTYIKIIYKLEDSIVAYLCKTEDRIVNCIELLEVFMKNNNIKKNNVKYVYNRIEEFNKINEDKCNVDYDENVIISIIVDLFKMNSQNVKLLTDYCIKNGLQIGRRHKKVLLRYLNYRKPNDLDSFFKEMSIENKHIDIKVVTEKINSIPVIDSLQAVKCFTQLWNVASVENDTKKISDYLFGIYSKLHAYYNKINMTNEELYKYNLPFIKNDLSEEAIQELGQFCKEIDDDSKFYDKYVNLLRKDLQRLSLNGKLEPVMNQDILDKGMIDCKNIFDRKGDTHYLLTEEYDAVYFHINQQVFDKFKNKQEFLSYVMDTIQQVYRILINNKVFAVEIDNIYSDNRNLKWLLYSYIGVYSERFIRTEEKRKFYAPDKLCFEMFKAYGIEVDEARSGQIKIELKKYYRGNNAACDELFTLLKHNMNKKEFSDFLDEWRYVYYGFSFNDCFVIRGTKDNHEQYAKNIVNDNKLMLVFYKYRMDERKIPCPICNGLNVTGNSYPEIGHKSWECKNVICSSRSKSNRGKRYSFKTNYMQFAASNIDNDNVISKEMISKWRKDIVNIHSIEEIYNMFVKYFSFKKEKILFINGDSGACLSLQDLNRNINNISIIGDNNWYVSKYPVYEINKNLFNLYFNEGEYMKRFTRIKLDLNSEDRNRITTKIKGDSDAYIINGDSFEILNSIPEGSVSVAVTSPPYFNARKYSQWDNMYLYYIDIFNVIKKVHRTLDKSGVFVYNIGDINNNEMTIAKSKMGTKRLLLGAYTILIFEKAGYELIDNYIWNKGEPQSKRSTNDGNFTPHYQKPINCYEHIFMFKKENENIKVNLDNIPDKWRNYIVDIKPVYKINCKGENIVGHTAPYPEDIPDFAVKLFGKRDKYVLDPFLGSGTSIISAVKNGYVGIGIESMNEYAILAKQRFNDSISDKTVELIK